MSLLRGPSMLDSTPEGLNCSNCGRFVKFQPCNSDKNGNKGVLFATCHGVDVNGVRCCFIRRAPSRSPSTSPAIPSEPTFPGAPLALVVPSSAIKCPISGCGQTRLADDCPRRICRKHCIEKGGCASRTHKPLDIATTSAVMAASLAPSSIFTATTPTPPLNYTAPPASRSLSLEVTDARSDSRFATHLRPFFTEVIADQQERLQQQNALDVENKDKAQKAKQRIAIYPWTTENALPIVKFFQDFTWPYLTITSGLLTTVGLLEASTRGDLRMYDEKEILDWIPIDVGYIMEIHEGQRLFLKDASLSKCIDFQKSLNTSPQVTSHFHHHLVRERAYVREIHKTASATPEPTLSLFPPPPPAFHDQNSFASDTAGPSNIPVTQDVDDKHWPMDFFTIDIGNCIRECSSRTHRIHQRAETQRTVFAKYFRSARFVPLTFNNQRNLWHRASASLQEEFMELGRCEEGLWSVFAKRARLEQKLKALINS